jgi:hypothetical protein
MPVRAATGIAKAELHYTTDAGPRSKRAWKNLPARIEAGVVVAPRPPPEANTWFIGVTDDRGAMVSSTVQFAPAK